ncbi:flavodoxin family protein [Microbispora sp. NPDC049125]|uniref:flavodoxin family protein n=1 Tax=Microbispora sp. NPDC049125 TaxID=3154929 RepID=UPI0034670817
MRALVVYESMFGNTRTIAEEVAAGLKAHMPVEVVEVGAATADLADDVGLLVVGGPTHAFGMSRASTRKSAADQADGVLVSRGDGVREWLDALRVSAPVVAAAFDTRVRVAFMSGSAARRMHKILRRRHLRMACPPESFYVTGTKGPLEDGERVRARDWASALAEAVTSQVA